MNIYSKKSFLSIQMSSSFDYQLYQYLIQTHQLEQYQTIHSLCYAQMISRLDLSNHDDRKYLGFLMGVILMLIVSTPQLPLS